jgi:hypothetical protein
LRTKGTTLSEANAIQLVQKYQPVVYLHSSEVYFPVSVESLNIDWSKATFGVADTEVSLSNKGPTTFDSSAPMYTSVTETSSSNTVLITYIFFYGYNGCGPKAKVKAKFVNLGIDEFISLCPADLHWGDVEHIEVTLSRPNQNAAYDTLYKVKYAYHQWSKTFTSDGTLDGKLADNVTFFDNTHPIVYAGNGSHASYPTPGDNYYLTIFSKSGTLYSSYLKFVDSCAPSQTDAHKWYGNAKLLKLNGVAATGISPQENNLAFKYWGRLGTQVINDGATDLISVLNKIKTVAKGLNISSVTDAIDSAESDLNTYFQATGCLSIGNPTRTYW